MEELENIIQGTGPYSTSTMPDQRQIVDKINEIVQWINNQEK